MYTYKEIHLRWGGRDYDITPTFELIKQVEQTLSVAKLLHGVTSGEPRLSGLAELLATALRLAGCKDEDATGENIYAMCLSGDDADALTKAASDVLWAMFPRKKLPGADLGNLEPPAEGAKDSETSTGEDTTKPPSGTGESSLASSGE